MSFAFDAVSAVLLIPVAAALLLVLVPGYRLSAQLNVAASLLTLLAAVLLLFDRPAPGTYLFVDDLNIPKVTYSDPEISSVGYTEAKAKEHFGADAIETYEYSLGGNAKSEIVGTSGFVKAVRVKDGPVVGMHMIGRRVSELVGEAQLIVNWEAYPEDVASLLHAHPTQGESIGETMLKLAGKPLHAHS